MTPDELVEEWKSDSKIDESNMLKEISRTPLLHSKYLDYYVASKAKLAVSEKKYNTFKWIKRKYFQGKMEKEELEKYGWSQWSSLKPSNSELNDLFDCDKDLNDLLEKVKYHQIMVQSLEYIMRQINQRDYSLKTMVEYMKFLSGA